MTDRCAEKTPTSPAGGTPEFWRKRALEARAKADNAGDPVAKKTLAQIANSYDRLAHRAERAKTTKD